MFDELKEVRNRQISGVLQCKILQRNIKLEGSSKSRGYLEPKRASTMELFYEYT